MNWSTKKRASKILKCFCSLNNWMFSPSKHSSSSAEIRNEIIKYSGLLDKRSIEQMAVLFNGIVGSTMGIDRLVIDIKDDMIRSVSNRLAYLLIQSHPDFAILPKVDQAETLVGKLLTSLLSSLS